MMRISLGTTLLVFCTAFPLAKPALGQPEEGEAWYAYVDGDLLYGKHVRVERLADGNYRYSVAYRVLVDLFGAQKQEISGQTTSIVTPEFRPVSVAYETTQMSGTSSGTGEFTEGQFTARHDNGKTSTHAFDPTGARVIATRSLPQWAGRTATVDRARHDQACRRIHARPGRRHLHAEVRHGVDPRPARETGRLQRLLAMTEVIYSNSLIESWWRVLKHQWLFLNTLDSVAAVERLVGFYVTERNERLPGSAFRGQTPDEMYYGTGTVISPALSELGQPGLPCP